MIAPIWGALSIPFVGNTEVEGGPPWQHKVAVGQPYLLLQFSE